MSVPSLPVYRFGWEKAGKDLGWAGKEPLEAVVVYQVERGRIRRMWTLG